MELAPRCSLHAAGDLYSPNHVAQTPHPDALTEGYCTDDQDWICPTCFEDFREGISINQFVASAAAEKLAALTTETFLAERAARASSSRFESALAAVAEAPPDEGDELPQGYTKPKAKKLANKGLNLMGPRKRRG